MKRILIILAPIIVVALILLAFRKKARAAKSTAQASLTRVSPPAPVIVPPSETADRPRDEARRKLREVDERNELKKAGKNVEGHGSDEQVFRHATPHVQPSVKVIVPEFASSEPVATPDVSGVIKSPYQVSPRQAPHRTSGFELRPTTRKTVDRIDFKPPPRIWKTV